MGGVAVVTDSTADLPLALAEEIGLRVVPLSVAFGEETFISRVTLSAEEFYERLRRSSTLPTTSQPTPAWFEEAYQDCADDGLDHVLSIHISSDLSGTLATARQVASRAALPVEVLDSRQVSGGLGLMVLAAQQAANRGADLDEVRAAALEVQERVRSLLVVDTLEYLKRGGRLSGAQALMGSVLKVKPVLEVEDGRVELSERTRTWSRALDRLVDRVEEHLGGAPADLLLAHALEPDRLAQLRERLRNRIEIAEVHEAIIGPVVGTHAGPGAIGLAVAPRRD